MEDMSNNTSGSLNAGMSGRSRRAATGTGTGVSNSSASDTSTAQRPATIEHAAAIEEAAVFKKKIACRGCRAIKVRCIQPDTLQKGSTCRRCTRLGISCQYPPSRRLASQLEKLDYESVPPATGSTNPASIDHFASKPQTILDTLRTMLQVAEGHQFSHGLTDQLPSLYSFPRTLYLNPLQIGFINLTEAEQLFTDFMVQLNPLVTVLDYGFHTFNRVHDSSPVLLSAILAVSARFFRKNIYASLIGHAQSLLSRAVGEWTGDIALVQAIILLVWFKDHTDTTAWLKIGYATRLARQLGLHLIRTEPLPDDEDEARVIIDRERTWIVLICFDITYRYHLAEGDPPSGIRDAGPDPHQHRIDKWLEEVQQRGCDNTALLVASLQLGAILETSKVLQATPAGPAAEFLYQHIAQLQRDVQTKYIPATGLPPYCSSVLGFKKLQYYQSFVEWITAKAYLISSGALDGPILAICLAKVGNFVSMALNFIQERLLSNTLDVTSRFIFRVAEFLDRLHPLVDATAKGIIYDNLQRLHTSCADASNAQEETPEAYCARFLALLLTRLGSDKGATPHPMHQDSHPPVHGHPVFVEGSGTGQPEQMSPNYTAEMPERDAFYSIDFSDASYWQAMFPDSATSDWLAQLQS